MYDITFFINILYVQEALHMKADVLCFLFSFYIEGGERGRRPPLPEIVRSSYRRLQ